MFHTSNAPSSRADLNQLLLPAVCQQQHLKLTQYCNHSLIQQRRTLHQVLASRFAGHPVHPAPAAVGLATPS